MVEREPNLRNWFAADELERCDRCGQNSALKIRAGSWVICTECGPVVVETAVHLHPDDASLEPTAG